MDLDTSIAEQESAKALGFEAADTREHPRMGTLDVVSASSDEGRVWIANSRDASFCQVGIEGAEAKTVFDAIFADRAMLDETLVVDPNVETPNPKLKLTSLRTPAIDKIYLGVQFVDMSGLTSTSSLVIQQYLLQEE